MSIFRAAPSPSAPASAGQALPSPYRCVRAAVGVALLLPGLAFWTLLVGFSGDMAALLDLVAAFGRHWADAPEEGRTAVLNGLTGGFVLTALLGWFTWFAVRGIGGAASASAATREG